MGASLKQVWFKSGAGITLWIAGLSLAYWAGVSAAPKLGLRSGALDSKPADVASPTTGKDALRELDTARLARLELAVQRLSLRAQSAEDKVEQERAESPDGDSQQPTLSTEEQIALGAVERASTVDVAKHRIADETRDAGWAPAFEAAILRESTRAFPNVALTHVLCKTTLCELKANSASHEDLDQFLLHLTSTIPVADQAHYEPLELPDGSFGLEIHVVRKGSGEDFDQEVAANAKLTFDRMTL
jgi:hypothetical protein